MQLTIEQLQSIVDAYTELQQACDQAFDVGMLDVNGKMFSAMWKPFDVTLKLFDKNEWIAWYLTENDCGKKGYVAGFVDRTKPITCVSDLHELMYGQE
jgi:hypothetical protein